MTKKDKPHDADLVAVWTGDPVGAEVVRALLRACKIESVIIPRASSDIMPSIVPEKVDVRVMADEVERARKTIAEGRESGEKIRVLFVCTHNKFRSQMAEGWLRSLGGEQFDVFSAGTNPQGPSPIAISVMKEVGIDISGQVGNHVDEFLNQAIDYVITVCDDANEKCPVFPADCEREHWSFGDPSQFTGADEEVERRIRGVRDRIRKRIVEFIAARCREQSLEQ